MRFTVQYPIHPAPERAGAGYAEELLEPAAISTFVRTAERLGYDAVAFTEHPAPSQKWLDGGGHDTLDAMTALGFCAAVTTRLRLIPYAMVLPYRNPFLGAKQVATLDRVSGGRVVLAAAVGYLRSEFAALGVDFDDRNDLFDEAVDVMQRAWRERSIAYEGRHFTAIGQTQLPMAVRSVPLWIAGNSARARQRAATVGAGWCPVQYAPWQAATTRTPALGTVDELAAAIADLHHRTADAGRDPAILEIQVESAATGVLAAGGRLDEHLDHLARLADVGVTQFVIDTPTGGLADATDALERYAREVIAEVAAAGEPAPGRRPTATIAT
ncbi:LLM class F420-dependent oxidoreductase [Jatrophihabitans fulvus]